MAKEHSGGVLLTVDLADIDEVAVRVAEMWTRYNDERRQALTLNEEARSYVFATDIDQTSATVLSHKNRTHMPKLTEISDGLQSEYFDASLSMPEFFRFKGNKEDYVKAQKIEAWVRSKLEQRKFRETVGRQLIADYVIYGNCFSYVDYVRESLEGTMLQADTVLYKGPNIVRISPLDIVFNPRAESFRKSPKVIRRLMHIAEVADLPRQFPDAGFNEDVIAHALKMRTDTYVDDWVEVIKDRGLAMDGFGGWDTYFKQDLVEILIYFGDVFDPATGTADTNQVVYVIDRMHVIRKTASQAPHGFDGLHHAGWRIRSDNLWAQGPLDNLVGMQYRVDHLENLKADVFDLIAHPVIKIKGEEVEEPESGYAPGAVYRMGAESDVEMLVPDTTALQADTQIEHYHRLMETFAGVPRETQGVRTPGEKTAFEVQKLDSNAAKKFVDKARNFELMLEGILMETFELMLKNFDGEDYVETTNDVTGVLELKPLALTEVKTRGRFIAVGARHWTRRNRETIEINNFLMGPAQSPIIAQHIDGFALAELLEKKLNFEDADVIKQFAGVKESVAAQAIAQSEAKKFQDLTGNGQPPEPGGSDIGNSSPIQPRQSPPEEDIE